MANESDMKVLVTGSTRGIGRAIAARLLAQGAVVGIHGRDLEKVQAACRDLAPLGGRTVPLAADLASPETAAGLVKRFHAAAGGITTLVNNAGGGRASAFRGMPLDRWRATFALNLEAALVATQAAYQPMREQGHGSIVNIASLAAHGPGKWMGADYAASKAGLVSLTKSVAFEAARFGIRVNAVSPGMIETDMTAPLTDEMKKGLPIPLARLGKPEEVAAAVAFLLSDDASYITGEVIHVNGGLWM